MHAMSRFSSYVIVGIVVGLIAAHWPGPWLARQVSRISARTAINAVDSGAMKMDRSRKGDRLSIADAASTEVTNTVIVLKDVAAPRSPLRQAIGVPVRTNISGIDKPKPMPAQLVGCEALASSLADGTLRHLAGRCFA